MVNKEILQEIVLKLAKCYKRVYGKSLRHIYLYGSYARGDYQIDSDIDLVAIVAGERMVLQQQLKQVWYYANDLELEYGIIISPTVIPEKEFMDYRAALPYYANIIKDGIEYGA